MNGLSIGIDVGGTFTDLVAIDDAGWIATRKVLSTPDDHSEGVARALAALDPSPENVERIVHGTTVATNTLLERSGAKVVLCATAGAVDLLSLRRQDRVALYDLSRHHLGALVESDAIVSVAERITPDGVLRELSAVPEVAERVASLDPEIVAVALLHSYADASHERRLDAALRERLSDVDIVLSSDVLPEIREYERTATTAAEAYLRPRVARYLGHLATRLRDAGLPAPAVMTSSGGVREAKDAARSAAALALSGPAGGVVGAGIVARAAGLERALSIDIGGTSADVGLILGGAPLVEAGGAVAGVPIALPRVLVETVSAGGGSLAWIDDGGALRVGPRSAGALPGPVAFGRGGTEPTVTDAHAVLGHLDDTDLGADVTLDLTGARRAVRELADRMGTTVERMADAMIATADAAMARALRRVSIERGVDPRGCALIAFGGAGPLHGCGLAEQLGITRVLVPPHAGVLSALGLAATAEQRESMLSVMRTTNAIDAGTVAALMHTLTERLRGSPLGETHAEWWARARYVGQGHELDVSLERGDDGSRLAERFAFAHGERFGFTLDRPVEVVSARMASAGAGRSVTLARRGRSAWKGAPFRDDGTEVEATLRGPASVALPDATLRVSSGWVARALSLGGWILERGA